MADLLFAQLAADKFLPIAFAIVASALAYWVRVFNVAIHGQVIGAAYAFGLVFVAVGDPAISLLSAVAFAVLAGVFLLVLRDGFGLDEIVSGVAINVLCWGGLTFVVRTFHSQVDLDFSGVVATSAGEWRRFLASLLVCALLFVFLLRRSRFRSWVDAVAESPEDAALADVPIRGVTAAFVVTGGLVAGVGGACITVTQSGISPALWTDAGAFVALGLVVAADGRLPLALTGASIFVAASLPGSQPKLPLGLSVHFWELFPYLLLFVWLCLQARLRRLFDLGALGLQSRP